MTKDSLNINEWIRFAQNDYDSAVVLGERFRPPIETVCFLCQQAAEKILKAYTIAKTNTRKHTHVLENLLDDCVQHSTDFDSLRVSCTKLTPYIALSRYPSNIEITDYDMRQALKNAGKILEFTKSKLAELGFANVTQSVSPD